MLMVLAAYGYNGLDETTVAAALPGMQHLMSFIPAAFGFAGAALMMCYPLTETNQQNMTAELLLRRKSASKPSPDFN